MDYESYYKHQAGGGDNFFKGAPMQRGHGLGNILGGLFRSALPMIKRGARAIGKEALKTGVGVAADVLDGQNVKTATKKRARKAGANITARAQRALSDDSPPRKKPLKRKPTGASGRKAPSKRTKRTPDIFD